MKFYSISLKYKLALSFFAFYLLANFSAFAQQVYMVKDINPTGNANISNITDMGDYILFAADDGSNGTELWRSDGTAAGTFLVKNINNGTNASSYPKNMVNINGTAYFAADDGTHGFEPWRSDGTASGTYLIRDLEPETLSSYPNNFIYYNNYIYFDAQKYDEFFRSSRDIWRTNGTFSGTSEQVIASYNIYNEILCTHNGNLLFRRKQSSSSSDPQYLEYLPNGNSNICNYTYQINYSGKFNNKVLVHANYNNCQSGGQGRDLLYFNFDNTGFSKIVFGANGSSQSDEIFNFNGKLYCAAYSAVAGNELWSVDENNVAAIIKNINPNSSNSNPYGFEQMENKFYFFATTNTTGTEIWQSDGTTDGTSLLKDINPGPGSGAAYYRPPNISHNGQIYFVGETPTLGFELWQSDGTEAGTKLLSDIWPGAESSIPYNLTKTNYGIYFSANNGTNGEELYRIDRCSDNFYYPIDVSATTTQPVSDEYFKMGQVCQNLILKIKPTNGPNKITGTATAKVRFNNASSFVTRNYEIIPQTNPTTAEYKISLYFSKDEFDNYNATNPTLPALQLTNDGQEDGQIANLRIVKYPGISSDGSGSPSSYTSTPVIIDPDDADIELSTDGEVWRVTFTSSGTAGYFLKTFDISNPCSPNNFTVKSGAWTDRTVWFCNHLPLINEQVIIRKNNQIAIPNGIIAKIKNIVFETNGTINLSQNAKIEINN